MYKIIINYWGSQSKEIETATLTEANILATKLCKDKNVRGVPFVKLKTQLDIALENRKYI